MPALQQTYLVQEGHKKIKAPILRASKSDLSRRIRFFYFDVKNEGESVIVAKAGDLSDEGKIRKVAEHDGMMNVSFTKEELLKMNKQLNRIRKPKKKS